MVRVKHEPTVQLDVVIGCDNALQESCLLRPSFDDVSILHVCMQVDLSELHTDGVSAVEEGARAVV